MKNTQEIIEAHGDQKWGSNAYEVHLEAVAKNASELNREHSLGFESAVLMPAAFAHDSLEDTAIKPEELDPSIRDSVVLVSRNLSQKDGESYQDYIEKIASSGDRLAVTIKLADAIANYRLSHFSGSSIVKRYEKSIPVLWCSLIEEDFDWGYIRSSFFPLQSDLVL